MPRTSFDWNRLKVFHAVAEAGSFTEAGRRLRLSQSAVSRQVSALEENFGLKLFHRHARGLVLTESGQNLHELTQDLNIKLSNTSSMLRENREKASGSLHITTTMGFGVLWLAPKLKEFNELFPDIWIRLSIEDYGIEMGKAKADVGILAHPPDHPGLIQRQLLNYDFYLFSSDEYLQKNSAPKTIADLDDHRLLAFRSEGAYPYDQINWHLSHGRQDKSARKPYFECNNLLGIAQMTEAGHGICYLPSYFQKSYPKLKRILPNIKGPILPAYFVYPEALKNSKRITVFRDFLIQQVKKEEAK